jgi:hypothetical protein
VPNIFTVIKPRRIKSVVCATYMQAMRNAHNIFVSNWNGKHCLRGLHVDWMIVSEYRLENEHVNWIQLDFCVCSNERRLSMKRCIWNSFSYCGSLIFNCEVRPGPSMINWAFLRADGKGFFNVAVAVSSSPCTTSPSTC